jgi:putative NADH-flavin reductase
MKPLNITVLGATGMVGSRLVTEAASRGHRVIAASRHPRSSDAAMSLRVDASSPTDLDAARRHGARLLVIGGAGPLKAPDDPELLLVDDPRYVHEEWRDIARASVLQLEECRRREEADWVFLSPPAFLAPGERTGRYRRGTDTLLVDSTGESRISVEDLAVAAVDELENPGTDRHITVTQA